MKNLKRYALEERLRSLMDQQRHNEDAWSQGWSDKEWSTASPSELAKAADEWIERGSSRQAWIWRVAERALDLGLALSTLAPNHRSVPGPQEDRWPRSSENFAAALNDHARRGEFERLLARPKLPFEDTPQAQFAKSTPDWNAPGLPEDDLFRAMALACGASRAGPVGSGVRFHPEFAKSFFSARPHLRAGALEAMRLGPQALARRLGDQEKSAADRLFNAWALAQAVAEGPEDESVARELLGFERAWRDAKAQSEAWDRKAERENELAQAWDGALGAAFGADEPAIALALAPALTAHPQGGGRLASRAMSRRAPKCAIELLRAGWGADAIEPKDFVLALRYGAQNEDDLPLWSQAIALAARALMSQSASVEQAMEAARQAEELARKEWGQDRDPEKEARAQKILLDLWMVCAEEARAISGAPAPSSEQPRGARL